VLVVAVVVDRDADVVEQRRRFEQHARVCIEAG
jgi:hypothetical protein